MHIISRRPFLEAAFNHPTCELALLDTYTLLKKSSFSSPEHMRQCFPSLDNFKYKDKWWVIDIGSNKLRLIAYVQFQQNRMYVKHIVTHAEYDKLCKRFAKERQK